MLEVENVKEVLNIFLSLPLSVCLSVSLIIGGSHSGQLVLHEVRGDGPPSSCPNRMSRKILVLALWPKMLSANQNARFFKFEYLQKRFTVFDDFLYDDI